MTVYKRIICVFLVGLFVVLMSMSPADRSANEKFIVVLDAGHGGKDPGNLGTGSFKTTEKHIALDVTLQVGKYIEDNFEDVKVIYTRSGDTFPSLKERCEVANNAQADLFISIHCNAFKNAAIGTETYVMGMHKSESSLRNAMRENASIYLEDDHEQNYQGFDPKDPDTYIALSLRQNIFLDQSLYLSKNIQDQFRERVGRKDRGVKQAGFYVISFTTMPSVLVELGFLTHKEEEKYLNSKQGKEYMASAIYRAFRDYKKTLDSIEESIVVEAPEPPKKEDEVIITETVREIDEGNKPVSITWEESKGGIHYEVQILSSSKKVEHSSTDFKNIPLVTEYHLNGMYKYTAGRTATYKKAKENLKKLKKHGFEGAFIIAFNGEERIDLHLANSMENP